MQRLIASGLILAVPAAHVKHGVSPIAAVLDWRAPSTNTNAGVYMHIRTLCHVAPLLLGLSACADPATAPKPVTASPVEAPVAYVSGQSIPFPANAVDTSRLAGWTARRTGCCMDSEYEWRARGHDARGNVVSSRSIYTKRNGPYFGSPNTEEAPLVPWRPHENTAEFLEVEAYLAGCGFNCRIGDSGFLWYTINNGSGVIFRYQCDEFGCGEDVSASMEWTPVSYSIDSAAMTAGTTSITAGESVQLRAQAFAPDRITEVFNQPAAWAINNSTLGTLEAGASGTWVVPFPQFYWLNESQNYFRGYAAGTAIISATISGKVAQRQITVAPGATISGPTSTVTEQSYTYQVQATGCNTTCTYQWSMRWVDNSGSARSLTLGTAASQTVSPPSATTAFWLDVAVTSNGVTKAPAASYRVTVTSACHSRTCA